MTDTDPYVTTHAPQATTDTTEPLLPHIVPKHIVMPPVGAARMGTWIATLLIALGWLVVFCCNPFYGVKIVSEECLRLLEQHIPLHWQTFHVLLVRQRLAHIDPAIIHRLPPPYRAYLEAAVSILYWQPRQYRKQDIARLLHSYVTICGKRPDAYTAHIRASVNLRIVSMPPPPQSSRDLLAAAHTALHDLGCGNGWYRASTSVTAATIARATLLLNKPKPDAYLLQAMASNLNQGYYYSRKEDV